jgi:hypothetical protein
MRQPEIAADFRDIYSSLPTALNVPPPVFRFAYLLQTDWLLFR